MFSVSSRSPRVLGRLAPLQLHSDLGIIFSMISGRGSSCLTWCLSSVVWTQVCCSVRRATVNTQKAICSLSLTLSHSAPHGTLPAGVCLPSVKTSVFLPDSSHSRFGWTFLYIDPLMKIMTPKVEAIWSGGTRRAGEEWTNLWLFHVISDWIASHSLVITLSMKELPYVTKARIVQALR